MKIKTIDYISLYYDLTKIGQIKLPKISKRIATLLVDMEDLAKKYEQDKQRYLDSNAVLDENGDYLGRIDPITNERILMPNRIELMEWKSGGKKIFKDALEKLGEIEINSPINEKNIISCKEKVYDKELKKEVEIGEILEERLNSNQLAVLLKNKIIKDFN